LLWNEREERYQGERLKRKTSGCLYELGGKDRVKGTKKARPKNKTKLTDKGGHSQLEKA